MALSQSRRRGRGLAVVAAALGVGLFASASADAHFVLQAPANWLQQDSNGIPIKLGPCGDEQDNSGAVPTGSVTAYQSGSKITVTINEVIFHPGHYRIALAVNDRSELPAEPKVDASASDPCATTTYEDPPVFPVLADNVFEHVTAFSTPQTTEITLPANVTCTHCTLQVIEFMSDHALNVPGGCFYHHCADLSIQSAPVTPQADGAPPVITPVPTEASANPDNPDLSQSNDSACGCSIPKRTSPTLAWTTPLFLFALLGRRLRRRKPLIS
ncbi:MAG: SCE4755 family polysaccharide monooxygenase-like protein [Polyangiaceae bacterium]